MVYNNKHFNVNRLIVIILSVLLTGLVVANLHAQLKKEDVNFEVLATVTMKSGDVLWNLAQEYYKDPLQWEYIKRLNKIPNERKIPVGTVIYIPAKDAKAIAKKAEEEIVQKKVVVDETALKIAEFQKEIERIKNELDNCTAKKEDLAASLKKKDDTIAELEAKIKSLNGELEKQAELTAQLEDMRVAAKSTVESREELDAALKEKDATIAEKEARISEMEYKLKRTQEEISNLESASRELKEKIAKSEKIEMTEVNREMVVTKAKPAEAKEYLPAVAAMAIAIIGAMIWVAHK
jgi:predicted nuclease with TOPRIM domain